MESSDWDLVGKIVPSAGEHCYFVGGTQGDRPRNVWNREAVDPSKDAWFAVASYKDKKSRRADNIHHVQALWIDIDCGHGKGYPDKASAMEKLGSFSAGFFQANAIIDSGHGIHAYWVFVEPVVVQVWQILANRFKALLLENGFRVDPVRTADGASVMRMPGSINCKAPEARVKAFVIIDDFSRLLGIDELDKALPAMAPKRRRAVAKKSTLTKPPAGMEFLEGDEFDAPDAVAVVNSCLQMQAVRSVLGKVPEPQWRAFLSVVFRCRDGDRLIHDWSVGDPRYRQDETDLKARGTKGPATCAHLESLNPGLCANCVQRVVTSPILLGASYRAPTTDVVLQSESYGVQPAEPAEVVVYSVPSVQAITPGIVYDHKGRISKVTGLYGSAWVKVTPNGVELRDYKTDTWDRITIIPLWIVSVSKLVSLRNGDAMDHTLIAEWVSLDGATSRGELRQGVIAEERKLRDWLAQMNLLAQVIRTDHVMIALRTLIRALTQERKVGRHYEALGWVGPSFNDTDVEDGFVLGERMIRGNRIEQTRVTGNTPVARLKHAQEGDISAWYRTLDDIAEHRLFGHAFVVLAALGSPLVHMADVQAAVISMHGKTNTAKTLVSSFAVSAYGHNSDLRASGTSTVNAVIRLMSAHRHVPLLWDEVSQTKPLLMADFLYSAANGQEKSSMTRNRDLRDAGTWAMTVIMTSNDTLVDAAQSVITDPHRRRLIELRSDQEVPGHLLEGMVAGLENHGVAIIPLLQTYMAIGKTEIKRRVLAAAQRIFTELRIPQDNRFGVWTMACAVVAGEAARSLGLIKLDPWETIRQVAESMDYQIKEASAGKLSPVEALSDFTNDHRESICVWSGRNNVDGLIPRLVMARYDPDRDMLWVRTSELKKYFVTTHRLSWQDSLEWMAAIGVASRPYKLAPGAAAVRCAGFLAGPLGLHMKEYVPVGGG